MLWVRTLQTSSLCISLLLLVILPALLATEGNDVAREGRAFQSSTYNELGGAEHAIDGSPTTDYLRGHCTHTQEENNPWWTVDLQSEFRIARVSVTNRGDCCAERLDGAEIRIGNSQEKGGTTNPRCATISSLGPGQTGSFDCQGMQGRYVTVTIPRVQYLSLCEVQVFGEKVAPSDNDVAREGKAFQSSTYNELGGAEHAIDGSPTTDYLRGHCTHTQEENNPWWTVDLQSEFRIARVSVTNRGDCCAERLDGAEILIGNIQENGGTTNPRCATISSLGLGKTGNFDCQGMQGRYVTVTIPRVQYLTLCEVQVFGEKVAPSGNDVAREGKAFQSSTYNELGAAENAIDGSPSTNYLRGHCTHTQEENNPWWTVDLWAEFRIFRVDITNRGDCCEERINGAEIRVGKSFESGGTTNPRCATINSLGPGETGHFNCQGMQGRYVTVTIPGVHYLSLCEVQVFGERAGPSDKNVALEGRAFQSSTYNALGEPENALDGSPSTNYLRGHCTHTKEESNPWWTVDLQSEFRISRVNIANRGDCCSQRLNGAEIRIGNLQEKGGTTNPRCATISSLGPGETGSFDCRGMQGRYVTVTIPRVQYLTLCEVQVFGERIEPSGGLNVHDGAVTSPIEQWVKQTQQVEEPLDGKAVGQTDSKGVPNVAIGGKAFQSSTFNKLGLARNAIDGSITGDFMRGSCIHTDFQRNPWWTVDLKSVYNVSSVSVSNREDCCAGRINGAEIRVGNSFESGGITNPRCATIRSLGPGETENFDCEGMKGQYVTVTIPGVQYLTVCEVQVFGERVAPSAELETGDSDSSRPQEQSRREEPAQTQGRDVAREGRAFQSTTFNALGEPENALDGSESTNYLRGHCTHTQQEENPWWTVDLQAAFRIFRVTVTNRGDCCAERLDGAEIRVGILPEKGGITNPKCATITSLGPGETGSFNCEGIGRFVTVTIPRVQYLTLCEVQVFGEKMVPSGEQNIAAGSGISPIEQWVRQTKPHNQPLDGKALGQTNSEGVPNVATGGKAFQSSTFNKLGLARNGNDGSISGDFLHGSCIHTDFQPNPWWTVDLKSVYNVYSVSVSNREDCCEERINGAEIRVGNSFESGGTTNPRCATISSLGAGETGSFDCGGMSGRYVTVTKPDEEFLTVCEVQVFGEPSGDSEIPPQKHTE